MQDALANMTASPYGSVQWLKKDLEFHTAIARATGNAYIVQFLGFVVSETVRRTAFWSRAVATPRTIWLAPPSSNTR